VDGEAAPLMMVTQALSVPFIGPVITIAAITAMLGVLLNLIFEIIPTLDSSNGLVRLSVSCFLDRASNLDEWYIVIDSWTYLAFFCFEIKTKIIFVFLLMLSLVKCANINRSGY
jgi:hypothetical protein